MVLCIAVARLIIEVDNKSLTIRGQALNTRSVSIILLGPTESFIVLITIYKIDSLKMVGNLLQKI
jgi:hypothetical protein